MKTITVLTSAEGTENPEERAKNQAESLLNETLDYDRVHNIMDVEPATKSTGRELLDEAFEKTVEQRAEYLSGIQDIIDEKGVEGAAKDEDVDLLAWRLGSPLSGYNRLYDGTSYAKGQPIYRDERLEGAIEVASEGRKVPYVVKTEVTR